MGRLFTLDMRTGDERLRNFVKACPTPTVGDSKNARNSTATRQVLPPTGLHQGNTLVDYVTLFPTPMRRDARTFKGNAPPPNHQGGLNLPQSLGGTLNPTWVEWLMGWPLGWTALEPLGMDKFLTWCAQHGICSGNGNKVDNLENGGS